MSSTRTFSETAPAVVELDGTSDHSRELLGGKAWSLNRMRALGLPVPPAFALTTACCAEFHAQGNKLPEDVWRQVVDGIAMLERGTNRRFGVPHRPLLVSVRSGAAISMPGMMDTVLNLGMNDEIERALAEEAGDPGYARDTHQRFRAQYGAVVLDDPAADITDDPWEQLRAAVGAVFKSWESARATSYRRSRGIDDDGGTAVTVQAMVFGNLDEQSGTGVLFSRNPNTGDPAAWGEWLTGGQGEDVVSGRTTPQPLDRLAQAQPEVHRRLLESARLLEQDGRDVQDIEFTVESGTLWLLQSRAAKRSPLAAVRTAVRMVEEGLIDADEAVRRVSAEQVRILLQPGSSESEREYLVSGEPAAPGLASGIVVTDPDEAEERGDAGEDVILVRRATSPEDFHGMLGARAVVTELGGSTSHAAVVSREIGRPCVVGCGTGTIDLLTGREVTVDGGTGKVWPGRIDGTEVDETTITELAKLVGWVEPRVPVKVYRAAEYTPELTGGIRPVSLDDAGDDWRDALREARGASGAVLETDEGIAAAAAANVEFVVVKHKAPALFSAAAKV
jgi:pyruvate,orthophosphate dikinase